MNNQPQSVDSTKPGFVMPIDWEGRLVDAMNGRDHTVYSVRLIGWNVSDAAVNPYCVTDEEDWTFWAEHIRFID